MKLDSSILRSFTFRGYEFIWNYSRIRHVLFGFSDLVIALRILGLLPLGTIDLQILGLCWVFLKGYYFVQTFHIFDITNLSDERGETK